MNSGTSHFPPGPGGVASSGASCRACPLPCSCCSSPSCRSRARRTARPGRSPTTARWTARRARSTRASMRAIPPPGTRSPRATPGTYETFEVNVPEGTRHSRLEAGIGWKDKRIDLDLYVYRVNAAGRPTAPAIARSAGKGVATERAVYAPPGTTVEPGRYLVVVDNVCSRDADRRPRRRAGQLRDPARGAGRGRLRGHRDARQPGADRDPHGAGDRAGEGDRHVPGRGERRRRHDQHLPLRLRRRRHLRAGLRRDAGGLDDLPGARPAHDRRAGARRPGRGRVRHARGERRPRRHASRTPARR